MTAPGQAKHGDDAGIIKALEYQGAFLKKHVINVVRSIHEMQIIKEELGVEFGGATRAIDVVARSAGNLIFAIECKKVSSTKSWVFYRDTDQFYRVLRQQNFNGLSSVFSRREGPHAPVCSEGYEYDSKATPRERSDQDPIYKAAIQLATAYLGFIERRMWEFGNKGSRPARPEGVNLLERYVPVLVTNAPLRFINAGAVQIDLQSGSVVNHPVVETVPFVILSQPAAIPGAADDFRKNVPGEDWHLRFNESIYVVNAGALTQFFGTGHRYFLMNCKSEERHPDAAAESPIAPQVWAHSED